MKKARFENKTNLSGVGCPVKFKFSVLDVNFFDHEIWQGFRMARVSSIHWRLQFLTVIFPFQHFDFNKCEMKKVRNNFQKICSSYLHSSISAIIFRLTYRPYSGSNAVHALGPIRNIVQCRLRVFRRKSPWFGWWLSRIDFFGQFVAIAGIHGIVGGLPRGRTPFCLYIHPL